MNIRTYTRPDGELEQRVFVHVTDDGYIRMSAGNLHDVLTHIGFVPVDGR